MSRAAALLAFGGAISFLLGAVTGFWLDRWMRTHPGQGQERYRAILHKEALWSSFLCFAVAGILDRLSLSPEGAWVLAGALLLTGWGACVQYAGFAFSNLGDAYQEPIPAVSRLGGAAAMAGNLVAIALLLWGTGRLLVP